MEELKQRVMQGYSRPWVVSKYSKVGLWPSEQTVCESYFPPGAMVLDLGCGAGRTTVPLRQAGYTVIGADIALPMVAQAARFANLLQQACPFLAADATSLPFRNNSFDSILFSYNGIELVPKLSGKRRVLDECLRILRPGGHLIFTTHALEAANRYVIARVQRLVVHWIRKALGSSDPEAEAGEIIPDPDRTVEVYYMQISSPRTYRKLIKEAGFEVAYYNSRSRIDAGKRGTHLADFDSEFKFYVARKP